MQLASSVAAGQGLYVGKVIGGGHVAPLSVHQHKQALWWGAERESSVVTGTGKAHGDLHSREGKEGYFQNVICRRSLLMVLKFSADMLSTG